MNPFFAIPDGPPPHLARIDVQRHLQATHRIVALGDSVTYSQQEFEKSWPAQLERRLKKLLNTKSLSVANAGIGGTTSGQALARWERDVVPYQPTLLIMSFVLNDGYLAGGIQAPGHTAAFTKHTAAEAVSNWTALAKRARHEFGADVVLWTTNPWFTDWLPEGSPEWAWWQDYHYDATRKRLLDFAARKKLPVVDTYRAFMARRDTASLMDDWLHHNAKGAAFIADCLAHDIAAQLAKG